MSGTDSGPRGPDLDEVLTGEGILEEVAARVERAIRRVESQPQNPATGVSPDAGGGDPEGGGQG